MKSSLNIVASSDGEAQESCSSGSAKITPIGFNVKASAFRGRAAVVTLGCAKNQVDSEVMLGVLQSSGYELTDDVSEADVAIINTCGFLESSIKESIDAVLEASQYKEKGRLRKLIVAGCMVERYKGDLQSAMPEADAFMTTDDLLRVGNLASGETREALDAAARPYFLYDDTVPRALSGGKHYAYVKVSEGCNRPCTFCVIPRIRGTLRSRTIDSVVREVSLLANEGIKEVNIVAQDLTSYGVDLKEQGALPALLTRLNEETLIPWIRLLYAYPIGIDERLLNTIERLPRVCNYLDLPLQHSSESVLRLMQRPLGKYSPRNIVEFIRKTAPTLALRTTFIVGFPGETESDIDDLERFILEGHFLNIGIFTYSRESGTPSHDLPNHLSESVKKARRDRLMKAQQQVVEERLSGLIGTIEPVLLEGTHEDTDLLLTGRTRFQAPEVDGQIIVNDITPELSFDEIEVGKMYNVEIQEVAGYDLIGKIISIVP